MLVWFNPWKNSVSVAREKVLQLSFIDSKTYIEKIDGITSFYCKEPIGKICSSLYFFEDRLDRIGLFPNFQINLEEVINIINPPDFFSYRPITPDKMFGRDCFIEFFWVERQMTIRYYNYDNNNMCNEIKKFGNKPSRTLPIQEVWYLMPEYFMDRNIEDGYFPWTGFAEEK